MARVKFPKQWETEYLQYIPREFPKNVGLYTKLTAQQQNVIKAYFKWRTKTAYMELYKDPRLKITAKKTDKIIKMAGNAQDWEFAGIVDLGTMCGKCGFGHAIRYEYYAKSPSTGRQIIFGSKCASDFFEVAPAMLKQMEHVRNLTFESIKKMLFIYYTGKTSEYEKMNYSFVYELLKNQVMSKKLLMYLKDGFTIMKQLLALGLPLPEHMIELLNNFYYEYNKEQKALSYIQGLEEGPLKQYALTTMVKPNSLIPQLEYHQEIGKLLNAGKLKTHKEDMIALLKLGLHFTKKTDTLKKLAESLKDIDTRAQRLYFLNTDETKKPAFKDDIEQNNPNVYIEYARPFEKKLWELLNSVLWARSMSSDTLRQTLPESRSNKYIRDRFSEMKKLRAKMYAALDEIDKLDIESALEKQKAYIEKVKKINATEKPEEEKTLTAQQKAEITIQDAWDYLEQHKAEITSDGVLDILSKRTPTNLTEKQRKFVLGVYHKVKQIVEKKEEDKKHKEEDKKRKQPLQDTYDATRLFVVYDAQGKRCAMILANDACRPLVANKFMNNNISGMVEIFKRAHQSIQVVGTSEDVPGLCDTVCQEYTSQLTNLNNNTDVSDKKIDYKLLSSLVGPKNVEDIKEELAFSDNELKHYARKIFPQEGVIDNFLRDVTAQFLYYRKLIRSVNN